MIKKQEKLTMHGNRLRKYIELYKKKKGGRSPKYLEKAYQKCLKWRKCEGKKKKMNSFIKYTKFLTTTNIKKQIIAEMRVGGKVQFAQLTGSCLEEFCAALLEKQVQRNRLLLTQIRGKKLISWLGFDTRSEKEFGKLKNLYQGADIVIGRFETVGINKKECFIPKIIIECKQYVDLTRLRDLVFEAEHFKRIYPYTPFYVLCEFKSYPENADFLKAPIDKIFNIRRDQTSEIDLTRINEFYDEVIKAMRFEK